MTRVSGRQSMRRELSNAGHEHLQYVELGVEICFQNILLSLWPYMQETKTGVKKIYVVNKSVFNTLRVKIYSKSIDFCINF